MSAPKQFTLTTDKEMTFWAKSGINQTRYDALFDMAKGDDNFWKQKITGVVEFESTGVGGTPINGILKSLLIE